MTDDLIHVIVIGKRELTQNETDALQTIGFGIATAGKMLHTTDTPGAPQAVAAGFRAAGREPEIHTSGLSQVDGDTICILDGPLATKLDQQMPDWEHKGWLVLQDEIMICDWAGAMVSMLEATGRSLIAD